jgi:peptide-methionine (S)-S-oxide reductase
MTKLEKATFGAGCFWHVEETFRKLKGVKETVVGFMGGWKKSPSYLLVSTSLTGHAEVVQITYDPKKISYKKLLEVFWSVHNPTTRNRQGLDIGPQYRSVIFFHNKKQEKLARESKKKLEESGKHKKPIVTEIKPALEFWKAEEYHQKYLYKKGLKKCPV